MCGKFTAMASWAQVHAYSEAFTSVKGSDDREVTFRVMNHVPVIVLDRETGLRRVVPIRWGFPTQRTGAGRNQSMPEPRL